MGEVVPGKCIMNVLSVDNCWGTLLSSGFRPTQEVLREVLVVKHTIEGRGATVEPLMEEVEEENQRRDSSLASG